MTETGQDARYREAVAQFGRALERLAQGTEADRDLRRDLLQEMHLALWRSFALFDGRCSLRTWVYRVAHNAAASYVIGRQRWRLEQGVDLDTLEQAEDLPSPEESASTQQALAKLHGLIRRLKPPDAQVMLLYLEDLDAGAIAEVTGLSQGAVSVRIHRIKTILAKAFSPEGGDHA